MHTGPRLQPIATLVLSTLALSAFVGVPGTLAPVSYTAGAIVVISLTVVLMRTFASAHAIRALAPVLSRRP